MTRLVSLVLAAVALICSGEVSARAQTLDDRFAAMSADLADPQKAFDYVEAAVAAGDIKGAIATLERMLLINPALDNLKLELGLLYFQAGRPDLASRYIDLALVSPTAPADVRERAEEYLREAEARIAPRSISGSAYLGAQYQENPNAAPESVLAQLGVRGPPLLITTANGGAGEEDYAVVAAFAADARQALPGQGGHELALDAVLFLSRFDETNGLDASSLSVRAGPRLNFGRPLAPHTVVRPYLSAAALALDGDLYFNAYGAGVTAQHRISRVVTAMASLGYDARVFSGSRARPRSSDQTGDYIDADVGFSWRALPTLQLGIGWAGQTVDARRAFESRTRSGLRLSGTTFVRPLARAPGDTAITLGAGFRETRYNAPDPFIDRLRNRREERTNLYFGIETPLTRRLSLSVSGEDVRNRARIPNFDYDDRTASVGLNVRF